MRVINGQDSAGPAAMIPPPEVRQEERPLQQHPSSKPAATATAMSPTTLFGKRASALIKNYNIVTPPRSSSGSLLRRVFSPSKSNSGSKADRRESLNLAAADSIDNDAPSIRRNLNGLFLDEDSKGMERALVEPKKTSPPPKTVNKRISCRFRKKQAYPDDDTTEEIVFEQASDESVFESAWSSDDEGIKLTEPSSGSASIKSSAGETMEADESTSDKMGQMTATEPVASGRKDSATVPTFSATVPSASPFRNIKFLVDSDDRAAVSKDARRKSRISIKMRRKSEIDEHADAVDKNSLKIFVLLLQPQQKIFELIQLIFSVRDNATVGDLLRAIPCNATQSDLANQKYTGLTRPKKRSRDYTELDTPVCASEGTLETVGIKAGEIMVALPHGFSHNRVVAMSKKILGNPRIQKLLERTNPLAPRIRSSRRRSSPVCQIELMEKVVEESEGVEQDDPVRRAMEFAAGLAKNSQSSMGTTDALSLASPKAADLVTPKATNMNTDKRRSTVPGTAATEVSVDSDSSPLSSAPGVLDAYLCATSTPNCSFEAINGCLDDDTSIDSSMCSSLQSYSSWSQSFDVSLKMRASTPIPVTTIPSVRINPYLKKKSWISENTIKLIVVRVGIVYSVIMVVRFAMNPAGYADGMEISSAQSLGVIGALQVVLAFFALVKLQHYALFGSFQQLESMQRGGHRRMSWAPSMESFQHETLRNEGHRRMSWAPSTGSIQSSW